MPGILAITILFFLYALSEIIALRSNAVLSTVLGISVILTIGFLVQSLTQGYHSTCPYSRNRNADRGNASCLLGHHH